MAKTAISPTRAENYPEWYQQVIAAAEMAETSPVRGCMVIKPWGFAVWERLQRELDKQIKATGAENAYFPLLIPLKHLEKEAAHVEGLDELWTGLYPTLSTGGRCIALSTPNGVGNWFHKTCVDAQDSNNDFFMINLPWHVHPDRDQKWFEKETKNMSRRQIAQELECNFNMSGETVFHPDDMVEIEKILCEPKYKTGFDRNLWLWEQYNPEASYLLVADVARGDGADYSVFHIIKVETMEVVGEYRGKPNLEQFASILDSTGREFGNCLLVVENNSLGISILEKLQVPEG